jgi:hypothetical protein
MWPCARRQGKEIHKHEDQGNMEYAVMDMKANLYAIYADFFDFVGALSARCKQAYQSASSIIVVNLSRAKGAAISFGGGHIECR